MKIITLLLIAIFLSSNLLASQLNEELDTMDSIFDNEEKTNLEEIITRDHGKLRLLLSLEKRSFKLTEDVNNISECF